MKTMKNALALMGALALALASIVACQTTQGPVGRVAGAAANLLLPPEQEEKLGEQLKTQIESEVKMHPDRDVQQYVSRLGNRIVRAAKGRGQVPEGIDFEFHVIDDDKQVNAFAIPGGAIYLYSGLLKAADSEAEVAGVLAHEIAHVTERHVAERLVAQYGLSALASLALGDNPGLAQQLAAQVLGTGALLKYSRDQEAEADSTAIPFLVRSGYDPDGLVSFFQRMAQMQGRTPQVLQVLQSHPAPESRVEATRAQIERLENPPEYVGQSEYQAFKDRV